MSVMFRIRPYMTLIALSQVALELARRVATHPPRD
jgi:hypothetical protein